MRNLLTRVRKSDQDMVATLVRSVFMQPDAEAVHQQHGRVVEQLMGTGFDDAATLLVDAEADILAFTAFPKEHWRQIWSGVDHWRGGCRLRGFAVCRRLSPRVGVAVRTMAPFPVASHQTVHADLPHTASEQIIMLSRSAGRRVAWAV